MIKRRRVVDWGSGREGLAESLDEGEEGWAVKGEGGAATGVGCDGIGKGGEGGAGEVVAIERDGDCDWEGGGWVVVGV